MNKFLNAKNNFKKIFLSLIITLVLNFSTSFLLLLLKNIEFTEVNIVVIYILSVLITSYFIKGYIFGILASILSMLSFNFFFTQPLYSLKVYDKSYIITFIVMLCSSIIASTQTSKLIHSKDLANEREKQSHILYRVTSSLAKTSELSEVATVTAQCLSNLFDCNVTCILLDKKNNKGKKFTSKKGNRGIILKDMDIEKIADVLSNYYLLPIEVRDKLISFICLPKEFENISEESQFLLDSVKMQVTMVMERVLSEREKKIAKSETERERFKTNLLRSISHDFRTPLTRITGASEMLYQNLKDEKNMELVSEIYENSSWLIRLVENILSLTRIQEGRLDLNIQYEAVEEIVASAVDHTSKYSSDRKIKITVPNEVLFVPMDGKLMEQVLINLINNAIEHTTSLNEIRVSVWVENKKVWFEVSDNGKGINEEDLPKIFDMFFTSNHCRTDEKQGMGLGLAICKSIINYHGGEIYAKNNAMGGATFQFYLNI